jgi:hypothetical protein
MGLRRAQGSRSKQYDSHERRHILVDRPRVRESGMRLPSEMARGCALSVAVSLKLTLMGYLPGEDAKPPERRSRRSRRCFKRR